MADILVDSARVMSYGRHPGRFYPSCELWQTSWSILPELGVMADILVDSARVMSYGRHPGRFWPSYDLWQTSWSILPEL